MKSISFVFLHIVSQIHRMYGKAPCLVFLLNLMVLASNSGQVFTNVVGSPDYVAPEVLLKRCGPEADVWTAGVILYILVYHPFGQV